MLEDPEFQSLLAERWRQHRAGPWSDDALMADIARTPGLLAEAAERNFQRWPVLGAHVWPNDEGAESRSTYAEEVDYVQSWVLARAAWIDSQYVADRVGHPAETSCPRKMGLFGAIIVPVRGSARYEAPPEAP